MTVFLALIFSFVARTGLFFICSSFLYRSYEFLGLNINPFSPFFMYSFMNPTGVDITGRPVAIASSVVSEVVSVSEVVTYTFISFR